MNSTTTAIRGAAAITEAFTRRKEQGGKVLVPYIMAGDPDLETTHKLVRMMSQSGVDVIELGMPFSDPLADGPVIQRAGQRALKNGFTLKQLLASIKEWRKDISTPIIIMTYYNLFFRFGLDEFAKAAAEAGVDGLIVPDLPVEEADDLFNALEQHKLALVPLTAPTSPDNRIASITSKARGFIYYVSRTGVTGVQQDIATDLVENINRIRQHSNLPIGVGFGVSTAEQAKKISNYADGVVIGSAIVHCIENAKNPEKEVSEFIKPILEVLHNNVKV